MTKRLLTIMLAFVACFIGFAAWAQTFTVTNTNNTFTITRSDATSEVTVGYRTLSMSALAGVHFTAASGDLTFAAGVSSMTVTVTEASVTSLAIPYRYQSTTSRTYRFEVLDKNGSQLAYKDRSISYGNNYKVSNSYLNKSVTDLVYFNNSGSIQSGSGNKYLDVSYSSSNWVQVTDVGYSQAVHTVSTSSLFNNNSGLRTYLNNLDYKMYATVYFTQKEEQDGYQYIQILADNETTYDGNDPDGKVNDPSTSLYKACFILSYENSGSVMSDEHHQFFPHRYNYVDMAAELAAGISHYEFDYDDSHLYQQKYQSSSYNAPNTGSLSLSPTVNNLNIRFDAAGSGGDNWDFKDLKVRLALVDATAPSKYGNPVVSAGPYNVGSTFTVSIPFNEIVTVSGTPTLTTSWGTMTYMAGSGSNVLTFQGTIDASHGTALRITGYSGTIRDYVGNDFTGTITALFNNLTARTRYNYNSLTGELSLNFGEFNADDKYWGDEVVRDAVHSVTATSEVSFTGNCCGMFSAFTECSSIDISNVNTSNVTDMCGMFAQCWSLGELDVSNFNTSNVTDMSLMFYNCSALTTLDVSGFNTGNVTDMNNMFSECHTLTSINVLGWNTSKVEDMNHMFYRCLNLSSINLSVFNTSNVTDMSYMFGSCAGFTTLRLSDWNTSKVTNLQGMFSGCSNLVTLYISTWDVSKVTNMKGLFYNCSSLSIPSLSNWNTASVTDMSYMFCGCSSATSVNISNWNTANVTNMEAMFGGCSSLYQIPVASWNTDSVTNMSYLFEGCSSVSSLPVTSWNTESVTNMSHMFYGCSKLTKLYLSIWDTHNVSDMSSMFQDCSLLNTIYAGTSWSLENVTSSNDMFSDCSALVGGNGTAYNSSFTDMSRAIIDKPDEPGYLTGVYALTLPEDVSSTPSSVTTVNGVKYYQAGTEVTLSYNGNEVLEHFVVNGDTIEGATFVMPYADVVVEAAILARYTFNSETGELALLWGEFNKDHKWGSEVTPTAVKSVTATSEVSFTGDCSNLFSGLTVCESMDLNSVNTSEMTNCYRMFLWCAKLDTLDLSNWNTSNVTNMSYMFYTCKALDLLNISNFNTGNVTNMSYMFYMCIAMDSLDVSNFNTSNVTNMSFMFYNCSALTTLDLSGFNTGNVTGMNNMFDNCRALESLDLTGWNTSNVTNMSEMFYGCSSLTTIFASSEWNTESVTNSSYMFTSCWALVGGKGTTLDASHLDKEYARLDGGPDCPGYFTDVNEGPYMPRYTFDSESGVLTLNWGEYNKNNKWGSEVSASAVTSVTATNLVSFTGDCSYLFNNFSNCESMDLSNVNTGNVTDMSYMFSNCMVLTSLDLSGWNTGNVTDMSIMFHNCIGLTSLDLSDWNTSNVTDMYKMFYSCKTLESLDLSGWNTGNVTNMKNMFYCCETLESLDVSGWNTSNVTNMVEMFDNCRALESLDLSGWNTANVTGMDKMFDECRNLVTIYAGSEWSTESVISSNNMFFNCHAIVGGMGTTFTWDHTDAEYARIDGGPDCPGYFTEGVPVVIVPGDVNGDGAVTAADVTEIYNYLLNGDQTYLDTADVNGDGAITSADITAVYSILLGN